MLKGLLRPPLRSNMKIQYLDWDTKYFGFKTGTIEFSLKENLPLEQLKKCARSAKYKLVYLKTPFLLDDHSIYYEEKLVYSKTKEKVEEFLCPEIEPYRAEIIEPEIYELALNSGKYSRYKLDHSFPPDCFRLLYHKWIENSVYTDYATDVLVYRIDNKSVGLLTYKNDKDRSNIGIIAVNPNFQGCGVGRKLIKRYQCLLGNDIKVLNVVTQGVNQIAKYFYEKNGYKITSKTYVYHLWL